MTASVSASAFAVSVINSLVKSASFLAASSCSFFESASDLPAQRVYSFLLFCNFVSFLGEFYLHGDLKVTFKRPEVYSVWRARIASGRRARIAIGRRARIAIGRRARIAIGRIRGAGIIVRVAAHVVPARIARGIGHTLPPSAAGSCGRRRELHHRLEELAAWDWRQPIMMPPAMMMPPMMMHVARNLGAVRSMDRSRGNWPAIAGLFATAPIVV